ncbi:MAG: molecular chaperone DnaJ [Rhodospirillaceae bacterium]|nr:molecular chaperone DnaJ [Rhodospirillaceae bacterium]
MFTHLVWDKGHAHSNAMRELLKNRESLRTEPACEWPGCDGNAAFKAPRSRDALNEYRWFCLDHIREYNRNWNYYKGMDEQEVEADVRNDTVWQRPTWKLGAGDAAKFTRARIFDPLGVGSAAGDADARIHGNQTDPRAPDARKTDPRTARALSVFGLEIPVTIDDVKARYKELVKRHHPDTNGGTKAAEEEFKKVTEAYEALLDFLGP